ncbi:MAG: diphosphate--fructose-6-phosphate 1-phosphotransferase [Anaerolineae bacterium]
MERRNVIVAQSGGPSPVINSSLRGLVESMRADTGTFGTVYAGVNGIEGVLREELLDLSAQPSEEIALLGTTPAAGAIGTCRYKLRANQREDFDRVLAVLDAHDVGTFVYIGGNDSMDTANKVARLAQERGADVIGIGVPKTIDNDVGDPEFRLIDHTPGYGSVARYWAYTVQRANEENAGSFPADPVLVMQAMGRRIGYIPAAARLADPDREMPLLILLAEMRPTLAEIADRVNDLLRARGRAIVVLSEGLELADIGATKDSFGHTQFSASETTVAQVVINYLNQQGLAARGSARSDVPGTLQRHDIAYASTVDLAEAHAVGCKAAELAGRGASGQMATILREPGSAYAVRYDQVPLEAVANSERTFPETWIDRDACDVTDAFVRYARPLIGEDWPSVPLVDGRMRFARLERIMAPQRLPAYVPEAYR